MPSALNIDKQLPNRKKEVLAYFRSRAAESLAEVRRVLAETEFRDRAGEINRLIWEEKDRLLTQVRQVASRERWTNDEILPVIYMISYCCIIAMLEARNAVWPYEYMTFSRRIGELWEPFCNDCFEYPIRKETMLFVPPLFDDVKRRLTQEISDFIQSLSISDEQKRSLQSYYDKVWTLVTSGEIKLALDLHFIIGEERFVVDLKSGFSSNEKGNTNRLLLVASIYKNIEKEKYRCLLLVRSEEDQNNNYLKILKNSGLWEVYCGKAAYDKVKEFSGFDIRAWMDENIAWDSDLSAEFLVHLKNNDLRKYLAW